MNDSAGLQENRRPHRRRWLLLLVLLPLGLGALAVAVLAIGEFRSAGEVTAEIARLQAAGEPVDNETMARWFQGNTSQAGTAAWREILVGVEHVSSGEAVNSFPIIGTGTFPEDLVPGGDWPDEPRIAEFLQEVRPLIARIEQAAQYPAPVWQPVAFDSFATLLPEIQGSRGVMRLLHLEVKHALYHRDTGRAVRGLAAMQATSAAFDWDVCLVADLVGIALRGIHRDAIRRSLANTVWEPAQLDQLLEQVAVPRDVATRWQRSFAGERAMALAMLRGNREQRDAMLRPERSGMPPAWLLIPSGNKRYLDRMAEIQQIGAEGVLGIGARAKALEREVERSRGGLFSDVLSRLLLPAVSAAAGAYEREELDRRLTRTALGIKRYHLSEGHWPAKLSDLAAAGLDVKDWTALEAGPFGYRVEPDGAVVWAYDVHDRESPGRIRAEPPDKEAPPTGKDWHVTRIR